MSKEINPRSVFDRLFGKNVDAQKQKNRAQRDENRKSILDFVREDASDLKRKLGAVDQQKLEEYLHAVREIERRVEESEKLASREIDVPDFPRPAGVPANKDEHIRLMYDMMVLAMMTDSTRVLSFMVTNAGSNRSYRHIGAPEGHHTLSHHGRNRDKLAKIGKINRHHVAHFAYFLKKLAEVREGDRTLLDNSMIVYGSGLGDGNSHNHDDLPILLAGRAGGAIKTGRHIKYRDETPLTNLYLSLLDLAGAPTKKLADSTGQLAGLEA